MSAALSDSQGWGQQRVPAPVSDAWAWGFAHQQGVLRHLCVSAAWQPWGGWSPYCHPGLSPKESDPRDAESNFMPFTPSLGSHTALLASTTFCSLRRRSSPWGLRGGSDEVWGEHLEPEILLGSILENTISLALHRQKTMPLLWCKCMCAPKFTC